MLTIKACGLIRPTSSKGTLILQEAVCGTDVGSKSRLVFMNSVCDLDQVEFGEMDGKMK
jgi:hypothetical protein